MKLSHRVNYILLPVILTVFSIAGLLTYLALYQNARDEVARFIQRELAFTQQEIDMNQYSVNAVLAELLNSAELINYVNTSDPEYQAYAFESSLYQLINRAREYSPGLSIIQIIDPDGKLLIASQEGDPFAPQIMPLPETVIAHFQQAVRAQDRQLRDEIVYQEADATYRFALLQRFSPNMLLGDKFVTAETAGYTALLVSKLESPGQLKERIASELGGDFNLSFNTGSLIPRQTTELGIQQHSTEDKSLHFTLLTPLYQVDLSVPRATLLLQLKSSLPKIILLVLVLTFLSFSILWILIRREVITPINKLVERVRESHRHGHVTLEPMHTNDEVAELNNAYLALLSDVDHLASYDALTGLANRRTFQQVLERQIHNAGEHPAALLYIDLDNFKRVNDYYGHATGDRLLQLFAECIQQLIRPTDIAGSIGTETPARLAGDEFALLLSEVSDPEVVRKVAERILAIFETGFEVDGIRHNVQASIGIAMSPQDGKSARELLLHADAAMYEAKNNGKNRYQFFNHQIARTLEIHREIEIILRKALDENNFELVFMPIYNTNNQQIVGAELLLRCPPLTSMGIGPDVFIPVAESVGLIKQIDLWVIQNALVLTKRLQEESGFDGFLSVNISAAELHNPEFPRRIRELLGNHQTVASFIELEITETSLVANDKESATTLEQLKALGFKIALDDFGTGYTAFNQLASYPVDCLKIDKSFVQQIDSLQINKEPMINIILSLAKLYQLRVIAEGVETEEQLQSLRSSGCAQVQGYYLSQPLNLADLQNKLIPHQHIKATSTNVLGD
jgi:diguanylate cyclase (GGDEF)-like protein